MEMDIRHKKLFKGYKVCVSGHRPKYWNYDKDITYEINEILESETKEIVKRVYKKDLIFMSGLAIGVDTIWSEIAMKNDIRLHGYIPCLSQDSRWKKEDKIKYSIIKGYCELTYLMYNGAYDEAKNNNFNCMNERNKYMVEHCDEAVVIWNGIKKSGTYNFIKYMEEYNKPYKLINLNNIMKGVK
jgi:uncharacterized phage-like protein YoqJ